MTRPAQEIIVRIREVLLPHHTDEHGLTDLAALYADLAEVASGLQTFGESAAAMRMPYAALMDEAFPADKRLANDMAAAAGTALGEAVDKLLAVSRGYKQLDAEFGEKARAWVAEWPQMSAPAIQRADGKRLTRVAGVGPNAPV